MPLRRAPLPRLQRIQQPLCLCLPPLYASFHSSITRNAETIPNHYEILELQPNASPADIKRQFFALSKLHHPDKNPSDPTASTRFVQISEAYHILSSPQKKASYDRDFHAQLHPSHRHHPPGSHSSHTAGYAGSRPPSGLSRRRAQFRGPPPSFYKGGGYGAKRTAGASHAQGQSSDSSSTADETASFGASGGFGPGQAPYHERGFDNDVPHFDRLGHKRTHENVAQRFQKRKTQREGAHFAEDLARSGGSLLFNFILVGGAVVLIILSRKLFEKDEGKRKKGREGSGGEKS